MTIIDLDPTVDPSAHVRSLPVLAVNEYVGASTPSGTGRRRVGCVSGPATRPDIRQLLVAAQETPPDLRAATASSG
jgi:hypothetical protein